MLADAAGRQNCPNGLIAIACWPDPRFNVACRYSSGGSENMNMKVKVLTIVVTVVMLSLSPLAKAAEDLSRFGTPVDGPGAKNTKQTANDGWPPHVCAEIQRVEKIAAAGARPSDRGMSSHRATDAGTASLWH